MFEEISVFESEKLPRLFEPAQTGDRALGPFAHLPGTWKNEGELKGQGWNMIALPFATEPESPSNFRLMINQYNEELRFETAAKNVPNRGITRNGTSSRVDQGVVALDYKQVTKQINSKDNPDSGLMPRHHEKIHYEPGLWLYMLNERTNDLDIGRLATVPHGNAALALGRSDSINGMEKIPSVNGLPDGIENHNLEEAHLAPYRHFSENPFKGDFEEDDGFPGFNPLEPHALLQRAADQVKIVKTTKLHVDTNIEDGGINNIPFIVRQANATRMSSTFWIQELESDENGDQNFRLQYLQVVFLEFFERRDGQAGLIRWPHVSINTLKKVAEPNN